MQVRLNPKLVKPLKKEARLESAFQGKKTSVAALVNLILSYHLHPKNHVAFCNRRFSQPQ
jgi:hypothetical protein